MVDTVQTLVQAREDYLLSCQIEGKSKGTLGLYSRITGKFLDSLGNINPSDVSPYHVRRYLADLDASNVTTNIHCRTLRTFFHFLVINNYLPKIR